MKRDEWGVALVATEFLAGFVRVKWANRDYQRNDENK